MVAAGYDFEVSRNPESLSLEGYGSCMSKLVSLWKLDISSAFV